MMNQWIQWLVPFQSHDLNRLRRQPVDLLVARQTVPWDGLLRSTTPPKQRQFTTGSWFHSSESLSWLITKVYLVLVAIPIIAVHILHRSNRNNFDLRRVYHLVNILCVCIYGGFLNSDNPKSCRTSHVQWSNLWLWDHPF